jgi:pyruvate dehydrogenase E2 component (dihydrolipoamide acetyltransferase)
MATVMEMPKLSDTMKEGAIAKWLKKEGDKVQAGLPVVEIETDKATMEFEAPASGLLLKIIVGDGQTCELNAPIAVIGKADENWQEALDKYNDKKKGGKAPAPAAKSAGQPAPAKAASAAPASPAKPAPAAAQNASAPANVQAGDEGRLKASPLAKKVAEESGLDLRSVSGSGPNGRIVLRDVESARVAPAAVAPQAGVVDLSGEMEKVPLSMMRKTIARRLTESVVQAPHFYLTVSLNMGNILAWRKQTLAKLSDDQKFSVNDLLIFIVARALKKHPNINSSWQNDFIAQYKKVHLGMAVALPNGLVTPVIRNADSLSLTQIAQKSRELIKLARDGKLQPDEYSGGTFTISNLGMSGIEEFTAIINPPQAAILAVGATIPTPVVDEKGSVVVQERMKITLSCDHRVIDGVQGAEFLKTLKLIAEDPMNLFFI